MKQGRTLAELAAELEAQRAAKRDFVADTRNMDLVLVPLHRTSNDVPAVPVYQPRLALKDNGDFAIQPHTHNQIAERLSIPTKYYQRMLNDAPALLAGNVNHWLHNAAELRMLRTMNGNARAFLSNRYRRIDNADLAEAVLPVMINAGCTVVSCEVTDARLYIKAVTTRLEGEVKRGDVVQGGIVVKNSETGMGALDVSTMLYRLVCLNGMIRDEGIRRAHLGRQIEESADLYSERTLSLDDKALFAKVSDTARALLSPEHFGRVLLDLQASTSGQQLKAPAAAVVELSKRLNLGESEREGMLAHLIRGGDLSRWGVANAVTALANDADSYDRASELEALGSQVIELKPQDWSVIAEAA